VYAEASMTCVIGFCFACLTAVTVHALQVAELHESALESLGRHRVKFLANSPLKIPGAYENSTDKDKEDVEKNSIPLSSNDTNRSAHAVAHQDHAVANVSKQTEYTISTPRNQFLYLKVVHTADDYEFYKLAIFEHPMVKKGWRPTAEQNHFLWYVIGPDQDGDVRLMNDKFKVMLTVKREQRLFTSSTWVGACSETAQRCPAQWLLYGVSNPDPEEADCLFVFHQSQHFMHWEVPGVTQTPYRTNLWRFDPPLASNMIHRKLEAREY
jgi:hypothetical protein